MNKWMSECSFFKALTILFFVSPDPHGLGGLPLQAAWCGGMRIATLWQWIMVHVLSHCSILAGEAAKSMFPVSVYGPSPERGFEVNGTTLAQNFPPA